MNPLILVVEDEAALVTLLRYNLEREGFRVAAAADGEEALLLAREEKPDLVLLDWMLPLLSGIEVCRQLRRMTETRSVPIIMLTARGEEGDKLRGLDSGADDYITKPFSPRELVARVKAVLRRTEKQASERDKATFRAADLVIDTTKMRVIGGNEAIDLTPTEFQLLATLARHAGRVFTRAQLLDAARGSDAEAFDRAIDSHIKNIRRKLRGAGPRDYVATVYGIGYRFVDE